MRPLPITNRSHTGMELEQIARDRKFSSQARRLRGIAMVMRGAERSEAARAQGVDTQTLRDWIVLYNDGGVEGLRRARRGGRRCRLSARQLEMVADWIDAGPEVGADVPSRFRLRDIVERIAAAFSVRYSLEGVRKLLRRLGFRHISPRPLHPKADLAAQEDFRWNFSQLAASAAGGAVTIEIWFQDEARAGQQGMLSRVWARKGTRPRIPRDRHFGYCYLFSAACPQRKRAVGHVCSRANTDEMNRNLGDISAAVELGSHAVVVLDGAGWHKSKDLDIPSNLSLLHLPPYSPELNPMENVFEYLKFNHLANRVFRLIEDVFIGVKMAWLEFEDAPDLIKSITSRKWAAAEAVNAKSSMIN